MIEVWTDGSCIPNPGRGGYAWLSKCGRQGVGTEEVSTNQRMEIRAAIEGIKAFPEGSLIRLYTDSQFAINGATKWMNGWLKNGWMTTTKQPVKNRELWEELKLVLETRTVEFQWVRGHNGNEMNELVDVMANEAAQGGDEFTETRQKLWDAKE